MAIDSRYKLKTGEEVAYFPPIQNTDTPYLTEAAMHLDQANQLEGYGYLVDGIGAFTYLGTLAETAADYEGFGGGIGIDIKGQYQDNPSAISGGLVAGDVYSLPYDATKGAYLLAVVGVAPSSAIGKNSITVNSPSAQSTYPVYMNVYNTEGTNAPNNIYLNGNVRADWGDVRILDSEGNYIPFGIISEGVDFITIVFSSELADGDTVFYIDYGYPLDITKITKIGITTDSHYDPAQTLYGRDQALIRLDNFKARMIAYDPHVILEGGDKLGYVTQTPATRLTNMQIVTDKISESSTAVNCPKYLWGWGNHDFEFNTFTEVQNLYNGLTGQVSGKLYAAWEDANFQYISLDANYKPVDDTHQGNTHVGYGYIDFPQRTWLQNTLDAATKPCVVLTHQSLGESDTSKINQAKEIMHVQNRSAIRTTLEVSGKVLCVIQGHFHLTAQNIINGIPYITIDDINDSWGSWDTPTVNRNGSWGIVEIDRGSKIITVKQETQVSSTVQTIYNLRVPYKTIFDAEYGSNLPAVIDSANGAEYAKPALILDPTDLYVNSAAYVKIKQASSYDGDPVLSANTIKIIGLTNASNYGRAWWNFDNQTSLFKVKYSLLTSSLTKSFDYTKLFNIGDTTKIATYVGFSSGSFGYRTNAEHVNLFAAAINTWYEIELIINPVTQKYEIIVDNVSLVSDLGFTFPNSLLLTLNRLEIITETGNTFIDNFRIEKFVTPSPSIANIS